MFAEGIGFPLAPLPGGPRHPMPWPSLCRRCLALRRGGPRREATGTLLYIFLRSLFAPRLMDAVAGAALVKVALPLVGAVSFAVIQPRPRRLRCRLTHGGI